MLTLLTSMSGGRLLTQTVKQMAKDAGITEMPKRQDQMLWFSG